jgi:hypothetical protein
MNKSLALFLLFPLLVYGARFYDDDPLRQMPAPLPVETAAQRDLSDYYDLFLYTFGHPAQEHGDTPAELIPAQAVNTLGEVPDNEWFTNRIGTAGFTREDLLRGPGADHPPAAGELRIISAKTEGITPGFVVEDSSGERYLLKFDPRTNPEMNSAADLLGPKLFHALGYNTPENYLVTLDPERLVVGDQAVVTGLDGRERSMTSVDVRSILSRIPQRQDGMIRCLASRYLKGRPLGPFRYNGTRSDDPNDVTPHEHRRDLRGLYVFASWLGHDDSRSINSLDMLVEEGGKKFIKHHLIDFGSILGSASNMANSPRSGNQYLFDWGSMFKQIFSLGLYVPRWYSWDYEDYPAIGLFEWEIYRPDEWTPEYRNPAYLNRLPDDTYWAAKKVMAFSDEDLRAMVGLAQFSDPDAAEWLITCLVKRRDRVGDVYFRRVLPLDNFAVDNGELKFEHLGKKYGLFEAPPIRFSWSKFDNASESQAPIQGAADSARLPDAVSTGADGYYAVRLSGNEPEKTVTVYLRKTGGSYEVAGIDRTFPFSND